MTKMTDLTVIDGIGQKRASQLIRLGIQSVEDLANWTFAPQRFKRYVHLAKVHMQMKRTGSQNEEKKKDLSGPDVLYIRNHSWWKREVELLLPSGYERKQKKLNVFQAVIYELCLEPNARMVMACQVYIPADKTSVIDRDYFPADGKVKTLRFTPQFIIQLNGHLPPLHISLEHVEEARVSNIIHLQAFQNNLIETNIVQHLSQSLDDAFTQYSATESCGYSRSIFN